MEAIKICLMMGLIGIIVAAAATFKPPPPTPARPS